MIPARNEAGSIGRLLASIPSGPEVVVVDDESTDGTAEAAASFEGVRVVRTPPRAWGWHPKPWACWTGVHATDRPVLVFVDADVWFEPGGFQKALDRFERKGGGLVSFQPWHDPGRKPYEQLSAFLNFVALVGIGRVVAYGPLMLTTRAEYLEAGGHEAVRNKTVEDLALARKYPKDRVKAGYGKGIARFRMYPHSFGDLIDGWTRTITAGAGAVPLAVLEVAGLLAAAVLGLTAVPYYVVAAVGSLVAFRIAGRFSPLLALVYPVPMAFFVGIFFVSLARGPVRWKGRVYR